MSFSWECSSALYLQSQLCHGSNKYFIVQSLQYHVHVRMCWWRVDIKNTMSISTDNIYLLIFD